MDKKSIAGKTITEWIREFPQLDKIISGREVFWNNPRYSVFEAAVREVPLCREDIRMAEERLLRFAPYISRVYPETITTGGIIESPLSRVPVLQRNLEKEFGERTVKAGGSGRAAGEILIKRDNELAVSGSIKARGGIYEVLKHAEELAVAHSLISRNDDYTVFDSEKYRKFFSRFSIAVGSTGNLGLSIGIMGSRLGFRVAVHMSSQAKQWKKDLLRKQGVEVVEYQSDYNRAVDAGRKQALQEPDMYFIDDENSTDLFLGYAAAGIRLKEQLDEMNIRVDGEHPLFVYLPCGVGGGPGGITFGLKQQFKDHVHCFFAEPTASPCMLLGLMTGLHDGVCVEDFGLDNITVADGLAVGRPSGFVGRTMGQMISGIFTVRDEILYKLLRKTADLEEIHLEPSALAGMAGISGLLNTREGVHYLANHSLNNKMHNAVHIVWATGGGMVPLNIWSKYYGD